MVWDHTPELLWVNVRIRRTLTTTYHYKHIKVENLIFGLLSTEKLRPGFSTNCMRPHPFHHVTFYAHSSAPLSITFWLRIHSFHSIRRTEVQNRVSRIRVRDSYLGLGTRIYGYGCHIQEFGFRARYKSALHLLRTVKRALVTIVT